MNGIKTVEIFTNKLILFAMTLSKSYLIIRIKECVKIRFILRTADLVPTPTPNNFSINGELVAGL
jgi:hypothetical protein